MKSGINVFRRELGPKQIALLVTAAFVIAASQVAFALIGDAPPPNHYLLSDLGAVGKCRIGCLTAVRGMDDQGDVAGYVLRNGHLEAFAYYRRHRVDLGQPPGLANSMAMGVNAHGRVMVLAWNGQPLPDGSFACLAEKCTQIHRRGFIVSVGAHAATTWRPLPLPLGFSSLEGGSIGGDGVVVSSAVRFQAGVGPSAAITKATLWRQLPSGGYKPGQTLPAPGRKVTRATAVWSSKGSDIVTGAVGGRSAVWTTRPSRLYVSDRYTVASVSIGGSRRYLYETGVIRRRIRPFGWVAAIRLRPHGRLTLVHANVLPVPTWDPVPPCISLPLEASSDSNGLFMSVGSLQCNGVGRLIFWRGNHFLQLVYALQPKSRWHFLRATTLNSTGQIAGVGRLGHQLHAFLLTPNPAAGLPLLQFDSHRSA